MPRDSLTMEKKKYYWTMKDGNKIDVDNMTESHLRNVIKLLLRKTEGSAKKLHTHNAIRRCFCGAEFNGSWCNSCGFDASEVDIF